MKANLILLWLLHLYYKCYGEVHVPIIFMAKIGCDFSGFFSEIMGFVQGLRSTDIYLSLGQCSMTFLEKLERNEAEVVKRAQSHYTDHPPKWGVSIVIEHKLPGAKFTPEFYPSSTKRPLYAIGRMMTESAYISRAEIEYAKVVDEVWVPTAFHAALFQQQGMPPSKISIVPEAVNINLFTSASSIPLSQLLDKEVESTFRFISVFKFEWRKGWDVLLRAFWSTFKRDTDNVELVIRSYKPSWESGSSNLDDVFESFALSNFQKPLRDLPRIRWLRQELSRSQLRDLYHSSDAFVLPTRGEGWCLPCVEAMASGLPAIVTNFSGPTAYLDDNWSYPLNIHATLNADGTGEPSVDHLSELMLHVFINRHQAKNKGRLAAMHVAATYSPDVVGKQVLDQLEWSLRRRDIMGHSTGNTSDIFKCQEVLAES